MAEALELLENRINTYLKETFVENKIKQSNILLTPRQKQIIDKLARQINTGMFELKWLASEFKTKEETMKWDIKLLVDFGLLKQTKSDNKIIYYQLNIKP